MLSMSKSSEVLRGIRLQGWRSGHTLLTVVMLAAMTVGGYVILERGHMVGWTTTITPMPVLRAAPTLREIVGVFSKNQTITDALAHHGLPPQQIFEIVASTRPVYNLGKVSAGRPYWLYLTPEGDFHDFRYPIDDERYLTVYRQEDHFIPVIKKFAYEIRMEPVAGEIEDSLFAAVTSVGEQEKLAEELADIFTGDIDFYTDIQPGDSFRLLVEKKYLNGSFRKYGPVLAASINNQKKIFTGFRFLDENGRDNYYAPDGQSLKKSFLKSPLKFARISSKFSFARRHPILKIVRPHLGVDYAAPVGTPVQAVGAGTVVAAGQSGANGKMVRLLHSGGYETQYLHLSGVAVRLGSRVDQTQVIGYVGSTGLSTGPHLDFRVYLHGRPINPAKVIFPPNPPIPQSRFAQFAQLRDMLRIQLDRAAD